MLHIPHPLLSTLYLPSNAKRPTELSSPSQAWRKALDSLTSVEAPSMAPSKPQAHNK